MGSVVVSDSAGILLVQSSEGVADLALSATPMVVVGTVEGDPNYVFGRVQAGLLLADGRIAVADGLASTIRVYDADGMYLEEWGGAGAGPGEFELLWSMYRFRGDSIVVGEGGARRISVFDSQGSFGRLVRPRFDMPRDGRVTTAYSCCRFWGGLPDGSMLLSTPDLIATQDGGRRWASASVLRSAPDGSTEVLASLRSGEYRDPTEAGDPAAARAVHFNTGVIVAEGGGGFVAANGFSHEVLRFDVGGELQAISRVARSRTWVSDAVRERVSRYYEGLLNRPGSNPRSSGLLWVASQQVADSLPSYNRLVTDDLGRTWSAYAPSHHEESEATVDVFATDGTLLATLILPPNTRLLDVASDRVLLLHTDDLGVESVRIYEASSPGVPSV